MKRSITLAIVAVTIGACSRQSPTGPTTGARGRSYAYVAFLNNVSDRGVMVLDITMPKNPVVVCSLPGYASRVEHNGVTLCTNQGLYDITRPARPDPRSVIDTLNVRCLKLSGGTAYLGCGGMNNRKLVVADISDPAHPRRGGSCMLSNDLLGVAAKDAYVYVANHWNGLRVIDARDPMNPHEVASLLNMESVAEDVVVDGHHAYLCQQGKVSIIDITTPETPVRVATFETVTFTVCVSDHYMYCANCDGGLQIVDVSDPAQPRLTGELALPPGRSMSVAVSGGYAYVVGDNGNGMRIVDISDKQNPVLVKTLLTDHSMYDITLYRPGQDPMTGGAVE